MRQTSQVKLFEVHAFMITPIRPAGCARVARAPSPARGPRKPTGAFVLGDFIFNLCRGCLFHPGISSSTSKAAGAFVPGFDPQHQRPRAGAPAPHWLGLTAGPGCGYNEKDAIPLQEIRRVACNARQAQYGRAGLRTAKEWSPSSSGVLSNTPYSFATRFENTPGTNPEELIAAAHAGCFSMALSGQLGAANLTASSIETNRDADHGKA